MDVHSMRYWVAVSLMRCHKFHWIYILAQMTEIVFDLPFSRYYIIKCDPAVNIFPYFSPMNSTLNAFMYNFDIVGNTNEKHLSFKENVAECYACVGVVQWFSTFSVASTVAPTVLCNAPQCVQQLLFSCIIRYDLWYAPWVCSKYINNNLIKLAVSWNEIFVKFWSKSQHNIYCCIQII